VMNVCATPFISIGFSRHDGHRIRRVRTCPRRRERAPASEVEILFRTILQRRHVKDGRSDAPKPAKNYRLLTGRLPV
jgi:hypothetical protein